MGATDRNRGRAFERRAGRAGVVAALIALTLGVASSVTRAGGTDRPSGATTTVTPPTTQPAAPASPATPAPPPSLPEPESEEADPVRPLLPRIVVSADVLNTGEERRPVIAAALEANRNEVAVEDRPGTLCAVVPVLGPVMASGRWERNGEPVAASELQRRNPPGYGECHTNDGEPFEAGVYQYVAVGPTGATSAAATLVIGVPTVAVLLVNNGTGEVCQIHLSPRAADFFEAYETGNGSPLLPGQAIAIRVANVEQDVRVFGCPADDELTNFRVEPEAQTYVDIFDDDGDDTESTPAPTATTRPTTSGPTTTS